MNGRGVNLVIFQIMDKYRYEMCDLNEFLKPKDEESKNFMSHEEFLQTLQPKVASSIRVPDELENYVWHEADAGKPGEICRLLRATPGIIQHRAFDGFTSSVAATESFNEPAVIQDGKPKFFLDENYFKFTKDNSLENINNQKMNNFNAVKKVNGNSRDFVNHNAYNSCEDNCNLSTTPNDGNDIKPSKSKTADKKYYNAREIYLMKRGKNL